MSLFSSACVRGNVYSFSSIRFDWHSFLSHTEYCIIESWITHRHCGESLFFLLEICRYWGNCVRLEQWFRLKVKWVKGETEATIGSDRVLRIFVFCRNVGSEKEKKLNYQKSKKFKQTKNLIQKKIQTKNWWPEKYLSGRKIRTKMPPQMPQSPPTIPDAKLLSRAHPRTPGDAIVISGVSGKFPNSRNVEEYAYNLYNKVRLMNCWCCSP